MSSKWVSDLILNMFPLCFWLNPPNLMMWKVKHGKYPWYSNRSKVFGWGYKSLAVPYYVAWLLSVSNFESFRVEPQNWQSEKGSSRFQRFQKKKTDHRETCRGHLSVILVFFSCARSPSFWSGLWIGDSPERCVHWLEPQGKSKIRPV